MKRILKFILLLMSLSSFASESTPAPQIGEILKFKTYVGLTPEGGNCSFTFERLDDSSVLVTGETETQVVELVMTTPGRLRSGQRLFSYSGQTSFMTRMIDVNHQYMGIDNKTNFINCDVEI